MDLYVFESHLNLTYHYLFYYYDLKELLNVDNFYDIGKLLAFIVRNNMSF